MNKVLVIDGAIAFRTYILHMKNINGLKGVNKKTIRKRDEFGNVTWEKDYYYKKVKRSLEEQKKMIAEGYNPKSQKVRYKEFMVDKERPNGYKEDLLSQLLVSNKVEFRGSALVCTKETYKFIREAAPDYFAELEVIDL